MKTYSYKFESRSELGQAVQVAMDTQFRAFSGSTDGGFSDTPFTLKQAVKTALKGGYWPEGAKDLKNVTIDVEANAEGKPQMYNNVVGFAPNVPAYLAGHPMSMYNFKPGSGKRKFIKIGVHIGGNASTSQRGRLNRGKAIMSVINDLELQGFSVEIWGCWRNQAGGTAVNIDTCIKHSDAQWNEHTAAFALANTAFQRRLVWRFLEAQPDASAIGSTMGSGTSAKHDDFDVWFPYLSGDGDYRTPERALDKVLEIVTDYTNQ